MQTVPVQNALDMMLQHDVTRIVSGKSIRWNIGENERGDDFYHYRAAIIRKDLRVTVLFCIEY